MVDRERNQVSLGKAGPGVFRLGLGCMAMSGAYGATDDSESIATIQEAIDQGVTLIDTGDFYGMGHNEMLIGRALQGRRDRVHISVKFGAQRGPDNSWLGYDARPAAVKTWLAYSLKRLGVDVIDVYRPARLDPNVPIEDTVGAIKDLIQQGYVKYIGLSEVGSETLRRAHAVHPIVDLQIEYSLVSRGPEAKIFPTLSELGLSATLYGVLSRGLLSGSKPGAPGDFRAHMPRFAGENQDKNAPVVARLQHFAEERGFTPAQLALSWVLAKQPSLVPLMGAKNRRQLRDSLAVLDKPLSAADVSALERIVPENAVAGSRYMAAQMAQLDSERRP